jgi:hypothetical protein
MGTPVVWYPSFTSARIESLCRRRSRSTDDPGFCRSYGTEADVVELDAQGTDCKSCDAPSVYGCEEVMMMDFNR